MSYGNIVNLNSNDLKLHTGCGNLYWEGYENIDILPGNINVKSMNYLKLEYVDNTFSKIVVGRTLSQILYNDIEQFISEISRVIKGEGELTLNFTDFSALSKKFLNNSITLSELNETIFKDSTQSKSFITKSALFEILNKFDFEITGFEFEDKNSWDDYRCIIYAKSKKPVINELINDKLIEQTVSAGIFEGINFDLPEENISGGEIFDLELLSEVIDTNKHADTLDYDLLSEVMDFTFDNEFKSEVQNAGNDNQDLLNEVINYNFNDSDNETKSELFDEIMNFRLDEPKTEPQNTLFDEIMNFNIDIPEPEELNPVTPKIPKPKNENFMSNPSINIVWEGSQFVNNPLALVNREICSNLIESGSANVTIVPYEEDDLNFNKKDTNPALLENDIRFKKDVSPQIAKLPYVWVRHQLQPKSEPPKGAKWIIMQPWEYSHLRQDMVKTLSLADEVWTPSFYSREAMIESGLDFNKVQVIPDGINPEVFTPAGEKYFLPTRKKLKFLYIGGTIYRKGFDVLLKAFTEAFTANDDVCLVVKENGSKSFYKGMTSENSINNAQHQYNAPEIIYIDENLTVNEMASLYRVCDVVVAPYRAESFGLPLIEGMGCGLPVIATKGGAADDFLEEAFTKFISAENISIGDNIDGSPLTGKANILEPSLAELSEAMLDFYNNPASITSMGAIASAYTRTKWTWKNSTVKVLRRLDYLYGTSMSLQAENVLSEIYDDSIIFGTAEHAYIEGDFENAVDLYMQSIKGNVPEKYKILGMHRIALILLNRGEAAAALDILNSVRNIIPEHPDTVYLDVIIKFSQNNYTEALELISPLMDNWKDLKFESNLGHNLDDLLVLTGDLLLAMEDIEAAHGLYTTALSINSQNAYACYGAGMCFKLSGLDDQASDMFNWAVKINPDFEDARKELY